MNIKRLSHATPSETEKHEMAGRMYEALDIARAIESGQVKTIDEVLSLVQTSAINLGRVLECNTWIYTDCRLDIKASIEISK